MPGPTKDVIRHLDDDELTEEIEAAQQAGEARLVRRLCLIKNLYAGDSITEAATRVGVTQPTASRWTDAWNDDGVDGLRPKFGGGRPPKLSESEREELAEVLERHQPLTTEQIQRLIEEGFGVTYSQRHVSRLLKKLGMRYAIPRPESPNRPADAEETLQERLDAALDELTDDPVTDGGVVIGFLDEAWPRPTDNSRRLWAFEKPTIRKTTPTPSFDDVVFGFYAITGESVVECKADLSKESVGEFSHSIRRMNPDGPIILVCDNFSSHFARYVDDVVDELDITRVPLPKYSPDLNPIEQLWKSLKRDLSPRDAADLEAYRALIVEGFHHHAARRSFADAWIDRFLSIQNL